MTQRLNNLLRSEGAMNEFIIKQREKKELQLKLSKEEHGVLESALVNVDALKSKVKKEMALVRVIDLRQQQELSSGNQAVEVKTG